MNTPNYNQLKEKSWVEPLSAEENAELRNYLAANPDLQRDWEADSGLTVALHRLPNAPVSSNFTSRVLQAAKKAEADDDRKPSAWRAFWRYRWIPRLTLVAVMLCLGTFSFHEYEVAARAKLVADVKQVAETAPIPQLDWLKDFDTINRMGKVQVADNELLMAQQ